MSGYNFTDRVRRTLYLAREEALLLGHESVGTEHVLLALLRAGGVADAVLGSLEVDRQEVRRRVLELVRPGRDAATPDLPYSNRAKKTLELAMREARELNHLYVGTEHLLLGLMREEKGIAAQVLLQSGLTLDVLRSEVRRQLGSRVRDDDHRAMPAPAGPTVTVLLEDGDGQLAVAKFHDFDRAIAYLVDQRRGRAAS